METRIKLVVIGNQNVGKTALLYRFNRGEFPDMYYIRSAYPNFAHTMLVDNLPVFISLVDAPGGDEYDRIRPVAYPGTDVFLLCFSLDQRDTFERCLDRWLPELRQHCPETPIVLVGCKCDITKSAPDACIPLEEVYRRAKDWGVPYVETSALASHGVEECFIMAARVARLYIEQQQSKKGILKRWRRDHTNKSAFTHAQRPSKVPCIAVENSEFSGQWGATLDNPENGDVTFVLGSNEEVNAHALVLIAVSPFFNNVLASAYEPGMPQAHHERYGTNGISAKREDSNTKRVIVYLEDFISRNVLVCLLQFLYTGLLKLPSTKDSSFMEDIKALSDIWDISYLRHACDKFYQEEVLNYSIGTYLNEKMGAQFKKMYFNSKENADVFFKVQGMRIPAHRLILTARCPVLAAMLSGQFREGNSFEDVTLQDVSYASFMALLEYIYTDTAPIEEGDALAILVIADQFCLSRLVTLCELYIARYAQRLLDTGGKDVSVHVINLLSSAQKYNAQQLEAWCLETIAMNYSKFRKFLVKAQLSADHLDYIEEHRCPAEDEGRDDTEKKSCALM